MKSKVEENDEKKIKESEFKGWTKLCLNERKMQSATRRARSDTE